VPSLNSLSKVRRTIPGARFYASRVLPASCMTLAFALSAAPLWGLRKLRSPFFPNLFPVLRQRRPYLRRSAFEGRSPLFDRQNGAQPGNEGIEILLSHLANWNLGSLIRDRQSLWGWRDPALSGSTRQLRASSHRPEQASIAANVNDNCMFPLFDARFECHHACERTGGPPCAGVSRSGRCLLRER
jgi:hypothetical protein